MSNPAPAPDCLSATLHYQQLGWVVIPVHTMSPSGQCSCGNPSCPKPGKHPRVAWKEFQSRIPAEDEVRTWWSRWPDAGMAVVCGKVSRGLIVLDIDDPVVAERILQLAPQTRVDRTPRGGIHLVFIETEENSTSGVLKAGIADLRGEGGCCILPPTPGYVTVIDQPPARTPNARALAYNILRSVGVTVGDESIPQRAYARLQHPPVVKGERHNVLMSEAGHLTRLYGPDPLRIGAALRGLDMALCQPPLSKEDPEDFEQIVDYAVSNTPGNSTTPPPIYSRGEMELRPLALASVEEPGERGQVVQGLIPQGCPTLLYGDGGQGKSFVALTIATCACAARPFLNLPVQQSPVLYIDWELDAEEMTRRAYRVARGLGLPRPPEGLWYIRAEHSVSESLKAMARIIQEQKIGVVVLDSVGPACGGDPEQARFVIPLMNDLRKLNTTFLLIDHQAKLQQGQNYTHKTPFGSAYKFNLARSVIQVQRVDGEPGRMRMILRHTKSNLGPLQDPIPTQLIFEPGRVRLEPADATDPAFAPALRAEDRVESSLREEGETTAKALAERTGLEPGTVVNAITKLKKQGRVLIQGKEGHAPVYAAANSTTSLPIKGDGVVEKTAGVD